MVLPEEGQLSMFGGQMRDGYCLQMMNVLRS